MTRFDPSVQVRRLRIERNGQIAFDEKFHPGVNIIRGQNSSGKSTILNAIFYGLGGDLAHWSEAAALCTHVTLDVMLNGKFARLRREISTKPQQPMDIATTSGQASNKDETTWLRFPYKRSEARESFSQAIFRLLGLPEVANEVSGNVTMHQVMRLLYADQLSPISSIFRDDGQFDTALIRETVGGLLAGVYDETLYENELTARELTKELDGATAELKSLFAILNATDISVTLDWLDGQRRTLEEQRQVLRKAIEEAEQRAYSGGGKDKSGIEVRSNAYEELRNAQTALAKRRQERSALLFEIEDSASFVASLKNKITSLQDSATTATEIGDVKFEYCPACFAPIANEDAIHACHLCKTPFDSERARSKIIALINDAAIQLRQSELLQKDRQENLEKINAELIASERRVRELTERFSELQRLPSSEERDLLRSLTRQAGYLDRQFEDLEEKGKIVALVSTLSQRKAELSGRIAKLRSEIESSKLTLEKRRARAYTLISDEIVKLLHRDLPRQDSFESAQRVEFNFAADRMSVDGHSYFSASSQAYLKNSFFVGFLSAAMQESFFRHPRFCLIDTVEDKGIEPDRSHNFQQLMVALSKQSVVDHQIIFATAMIAPDLEIPEYTVGRVYTRERRSLDIR